jgi:hypothetical protein
MTTHFIVFDPAKPNQQMALLTLRYAKPNNTPAATVTAACRYLCATGCNYENCVKALVAGGYTQAEALAMVTACYPTLPIVPPPP